MKTKSQRVLKKIRSDLSDLNQTRHRKDLLIWTLLADQIIITKNLNIQAITESLIYTNP